MKTKVKVVLITIILLVMAMSFEAFAQPEVEVDWGEQKHVVIKVNGVDVFLGNGEPEPFIDEKGRTQVPIRFVSEALGCRVIWEDKEKSVSITNEKDTIKLFIGKSFAVKNGKNLFFDTVPFIKGDRTFVPVRFISEVFLNAKVDWDPKIKLVSITMDKELMIPSDLKKIRSDLGENNVVASSKGLSYSSSGVPTTYNCDVYINIDDFYQVVIGINKYDEKSLEALKVILKFYYPTQYEDAYSKVLETVNGEVKKDSKTLEYQGIKGLYFDNKYYKSVKFEDGTCVSIGKAGAKYD